MNDTDVAAAERLIAKWKGVNASELSTSQPFLIDLCAGRVNLSCRFAEKDSEFVGACA